MAAAALLLLTQQQASAWCNFNFSTGVNTSFSGGGTKLLWGLYQSQPSADPNQPGCAPQFDPGMMQPPQMQQPCGGGRGLFRNRGQQCNQQQGYGGYGQSPYYNPAPQYGYYPYPGAMEVPVTAYK